MHLGWHFTTNPSLQMLIRALVSVLSRFSIAQIQSFAKNNCAMMTLSDKFAFIILFYCANKADVRHWWLISDLTLTVWLVLYLFRCVSCPLVTFHPLRLSPPPQEKAMSAWFYLCVCVHMWVCFCVEWGFKRPLSGFDPGFNLAPIDRPFRPDYGLASQTEMLLSARHKSQASRAPLNCISKVAWSVNTPVRRSRPSVRTSKLFHHCIALSIYTICSSGYSEPD